MSIEVLGEVSGLGYGLAVLASLLVFPLLVAWLGVRGPIRREVEAQASLLMMTGLAAAMLWLVMPSLLYAFVLDSSTATTQPSPATTSPSVSLTGAQRAWLSATVPLLPLLMMVSVFFSSPARVQGLGLRQADFGRGAAIGIGALLVILPLVWSMSAITLVLWESLGYTHPRAHDLLVTYHDDKSDRLTRSVVWFAA
ncbi:MAG TPA: hypothetical protein PKB10_13475, partial [Tepidisphaeraceae bacterium]|nr:hypothetical protein [Tepidisphaeraceae bacterium]